ncbi:hypothetical protein BRO54_1487 [Geobacillus proteiniphilus]|uniref:Uncharacterized protein n=1 Tax=Geobacillus proteiniphilus TaxID=860353 RepID=A0A1Q5T2Z7_9BACL|nr:hypothetical protein BRO54_1487 [Geobacillus proteiniphilus]
MRMLIPNGEFVAAKPFVRWRSCLGMTAEKPDLCAIFTVHAR